MCRYSLILHSASFSYVLFDHINTNAITHVYIDLGIKNAQINNINYSISVRDYAKIFKALYYEDYLNSVMSQKALQYLEASQYKNGLVAAIPSNIPVAEKFGERIIYSPKKINQFHECGIIYYPKNPYLLCVMTDGNNIYNQAKVIKDISQLVYQNVDQQSNKSYLGVNWNNTH